MVIIVESYVDCSTAKSLLVWSFDCIENVRSIIIWSIHSQMMMIMWILKFKYEKKTEFFSTQNNQARIRILFVWCWPVCSLDSMWLMMSIDVNLERMKEVKKQKKSVNDDDVKQTTTKTVYSFFSQKSIFFDTFFLCFHATHNRRTEIIIIVIVVVIAADWWIFKIREFELHFKSNFYKQNVSAEK